jgi:two-component system, chemotaxis family, sensor kinase CheA
MANELAQDVSLLQDFLTECDELLEQLNQDLVAIESSPEDNELLNRIFRAFHTIKGTSGFMGFRDIVAITHQAEDVLNLMRKGERKVTHRATDVFLNVLDQLRRMLDDVRQGAPREYELGELLGRVHQLMELDEPHRPMLGEILVADGTISHAERREALQQAVETGQRLGQVLIEKQVATPDQIRESLEKQAVVTGDVREAARTIRVDVNKLDELVNLTGELVLERNRMAQLTRDFSVRRFSSEEFERLISESSSRLSFVTEELQAASLKTRMVPIDVVFRRFPRMIRDLSNSLGKEVSLVIRGGDTELDKTIVEEIADPIVHLIRNSLDHGIEPPSAREKAGKPRKGTMRLEARPEGDFIIVQIEDDGAGIDPERIATKAVEKGIVTFESVKAMTHREILDLIFLPGFSTAEKTSDISGRGVGMDVVRTNMKKLNGIVELDSEVGRGTKVTLKLSLTLAILPVLLVRVGEATYALPLRSVSEILRVDAHQIHEGDTGEMLHVRNQIIPVGRLATVLNLDRTLIKSDARLRVVVIAIGERKLGLVVDDFLGQEETVIKPLGSQLGHVSGVAGSTIT